MSKQRKEKLEVSQLNKMTDDTGEKMKLEGHKKRKRGPHINMRIQAVENVSQEHEICYLNIPSISLALAELPVEWNPQQMELQYARAFSLSLYYGSYLDSIIKNKLARITKYEEGNSKARIFLATITQYMHQYECHLD